MSMLAQGEAEGKETILGETFGVSEWRNVVATMKKNLHQ